MRRPTPGGNGCRGGSGGGAPATGGPGDEPNEGQCRTGGSGAEGRSTGPGQLGEGDRGNPAATDGRSGVAGHGPHPGTGGTGPRGAGGDDGGVGVGRGRRVVAAAGVLEGRVEVEVRVAGVVVVGVVGLVVPRK